MAGAGDQLRLYILYKCSTVALVVHFNGKRIESSVINDFVKLFCRIHSAGELSCHIYNGFARCRSHGSSENCRSDQYLVEEDDVPGDLPELHDLLHDLL